MKAVAISLAIALSATSALAQSSDHPIADSAAQAAKAPAESSSHGGRGKLFWSGLALGIAGTTTGVLATTVARVEDKSSGNAPPTAFQACVAQKSDPIYAGNNCDALKAKNVPMLAAAAALGAAGAVLMIAGSRASAEVRPGVVRFGYRIRF
jgi:hypothetical protein